MATNVGTLKDKNGDIFLPRTDASLITGLSAVARNGSYNNLTNRPDLSAFITNTVSNLLNYYSKNETYTKAEIQALVHSANGFYYQTADVLPEASASTVGMIYLIPSNQPENRNLKEEYITLENNGIYSWELIGNTAIDLSGYVTIEALNEALAAKQSELVSGTNIKTIANQTLLGSGDITKTFTFDNEFVPSLPLGNEGYVKDIGIEFLGQFNSFTALVSIPTQKYMAIVEVDEDGAQVLNFDGVSELKFARPTSGRYVRVSFNINEEQNETWSGIVHVVLLSGDFDGAVYCGFIIHHLGIGVTEEDQPIKNIYVVPTTGIPESDLEEGIIPTFKTFANQSFTGNGDLVKEYDVSTNALCLPDGLYTCVLYGGSGYAIISHLNGTAIYDYGLIASGQYTNSNSIALSFNTGITEVHVTHLAGEPVVPTTMSLTDFAELDNEVSIIKYFKSIDVDLTPTLNSTNLVTSNGVYSKINGLSVQFNPSTSLLSLKSGNTILSSVDVSDFSITGFLNSASLNNDVLTLNFSSGDTVNLNIANVISEILTDYTDEVQELIELHTVLSEDAYELLAEKDPNKFYYIYED